MRVLSLWKKTLPLILLRRGLFHFVFVVALTLGFWSCSASEVYVQSPEMVRKLYYTRSAQSLEQLIALLEDSKRELNDAALLYIDKALFILSSEEKTGGYKKDVIANKALYINNMKAALMACVSKKNNFNTQNLCLFALRNVVDPEVDALLAQLLENPSLEHTKTLLEVYRYRGQNLPASVFEHFTEWVDKKKLLIAQFYLENEPMENTVLTQIENGLSGVKDPYIRGILEKRLSLLEFSETSPLEKPHE